MHDRKGNEIEVGSRVAYNLSGEVATGVVVRFRDGVERTMPSWPMWDKPPLIFVKPDPAYSRIASKKGESKIEVWTRPDEPVGKVVVLDA